MPSILPPFQDTSWSCKAAMNWQFLRMSWERQVMPQAHSDKGKFSSARKKPCQAVMLGREEQMSFCPLFCFKSQVSRQFLELPPPRAWCCSRETAIERGVLVEMLPSSRW